MLLARSDSPAHATMVGPIPSQAVAAARVRVGIVSWNTAALLNQCLLALPAALAGTDAEVVVVDNDSADASGDVAAPYPGVRVIRNRTNVGYAKAMNQALAGAGSQVLIALNPDTAPPPGSLATLVERLLADPGVGLVAPRLVNPDGTDQYTARCFPGPAGAAAACFVPKRWQGGRIGRRFRLEAAAGPKQPTDIDWAIGAVHVIRAAALHGRPPYDERWFMYVEDVELCWWLAQRGWRRRIEADVTVPHVGNAAGDQRGVTSTSAGASTPSTTGTTGTGGRARFGSWRRSTPWRWPAGPRSAWWPGDPGTMWLPCDGNCPTTPGSCSTGPRPRPARPD